MTWGIWNKIKKGFEKVKSKAIPAITKSVDFVKNNKELIDAGIDYFAPKYTHTVCVTYYKASPYNISHTKNIFTAKYNRVI